MKICLFLIFVSIFTFFMSAGCASTKPRHVWTNEALAVDRLVVEGRFEEADARYADLLVRAPSEERRRWVMLERANVAMQSGDTELAMSRYQEIVDEPFEDWIGGRALLTIARFEAKDDETRALDVYEKVIFRYSETVSAEFAMEESIELLARIGRKNETPALLRRIANDRQRSDIGDTALFRLAIYHRDHRELQSAVETFDEVTRIHPKSSLVDDALWEGAHVYMSLQMWEPAIVRLTLLKNRTETSWFVGTYDSQWVSRSIIELGRIHLLYLDRPEEARRYFDLFLRRYPEHLQRSRVAWYRVETFRFEGDLDRFALERERFLQEYEWGRFVRLAKRSQGLPL